MERRDYRWLVGLLAMFGTACSELPQEIVYTNSLGMRFVRIEPGEFLMGESVTPLPKELVRPLSYPTLEEMERRFRFGDPRRFVLNLDHVRFGDFDERPVHRVRITQPFYMGIYEVTNAQYEAFAPEHRQLRGKMGFSREDDEAVVFVSWYEAQAFCDWLRKKEGFPYRLPTEAEWEYACRAGTTTPFFTGFSLPREYHKNQRRTSFKDPQHVVSLQVGQTPPNPWGLYDMHGNVEEWCYDWYGPYQEGDVANPVGVAKGDFKVTRGGSHGTNLYYLRSANRSGALPEEQNWLIGFRVVLGELPSSKPSPPPPLERYQLEVDQVKRTAGPPGYRPDEPYFKGPRRYVKIPPNSQGPLYSHHNHDPAIVECPNGDLLAIWYTCVEERGRELAIAASRLRYGAEEWEPASLFWDTPDRNDHCPALWFDGEDTLYHFNGVSIAGMWEPLAVILRTSRDNGVTWSKARYIVPEHGFRQMVGEPVLRTRGGVLLFGADAGDGSTIWMSRDGGETWVDPGGTIHGIHAGIVELQDGRLMAFGRGMNIEGRMPKSVSEDLGKTWVASPTPFPPIRGGQRLVLLRLREGPLFFASFTDDLWNSQPGEHDRRGRTSLFAAVSYDEGETWPVRRIITNGEPDHRQTTIDGGPIRMSPTSSEPLGYLSVCQSRNGIIHLITSINHYAFNLAWLTEEVKDPGKWPRAKRLAPQKDLAVLFEGTRLPTQADPPWNFLGVAQDEERVVRVLGSLLDVRAVGRNLARWSNERLPGLSGRDLDAGVTVELNTRILESRGSAGIDLELFVRGGTLTVNHYRLTITRDSVYYSLGNEKLLLAKEVNNGDRFHRFRMAVRPDTAVQIYRDGKLLSVEPMDLLIDWRRPARGSYVEWGTSGPGVRAQIRWVGYDISGAFAPGD